jgi:acetoin utilization deacetylase AcuC-like enzyme
MLVVYSPQCLGYETPGHPESPARVKRIHDVLKENGFRFIRAGPAGKQDVLLVHTPEHFEHARKMDYAGLETPPIDIRFPLLAAGVTIKAGERLGFALTRPPGHHAGRDSMGGFCYFNNIAIAVRKLGVRTAILDLDTHHGNGTQEIFMGDRSVLYVSLHQSPLYPGTGLASESNCRNFPLFPGTDEGTYLKTLAKALAVIEGFKPQLLAVSMGFDTFRGDPLAGQQVTERGYGTIGKMVKGLNLPTFIALEGGYSEKTGELCLNFMRQL